MATVLYLLLCCATTTLLLANALELTPHLLSAAAAAGHGLSKSKALHYAPFPLDDAVELPLDVAESDDLEGIDQEALATGRQHALPPPWLHFADDEPPKPKILIKQSGKQHGHAHGMHHNTASHSGERRCTIEITSKIPGSCQLMTHIGNTCVSGDYMDVLNADCK